MNQLCAFFILKIVSFQNRQKGKIEQFLTIEVLFSFLFHQLDV